MQVLPAPLSNDQGMHDLGETSATALAVLWQKVGIPIIYPDIDSLPEALLDILAKDFKVDWYRYDYSIRAKRALIKDAIFVHKHMGTVAAVEKALTDVWPPSSVEEWFEYGGDPYFFRVILEAQSAEEPIMVNSALDVIHFYKPVRAHLEGDLPIVRVTFGIVIKTSKESHKYHVDSSGTKPRWATHGNKSNEQIVVETEPHSSKYQSPVTGQMTAGLWPIIATHGVRSASNVIVESDDEGHTYNPPLTGQATAGTHPNIATHGNADANGLYVGVSASESSYAARPCGTSLNSLM